VGAGSHESESSVAGMMDRLSVLCFAGTYGLALAGDLARFAVRGEVRRYAALGLTALGWLVHTAYLGNLVWTTREFPVTTVFESLLVLAWILVAIDLYLEVRSPRPVAVGVFLLPVVLGVLAVAAKAPREDWTGWGGGWMTFWGAVHGVLLLAGAVFTCVAFAAGLMYLVQADRLKQKRPPRMGVALPSLEQSERWNRGAITLAFPMLTFGLLIGLGLMLAARSTRGEILGWSDPKVIATLALWFVFALLLHARFRPEWRGKRVMVLTVVAFAFLAFAMVGVGPILPTAHGGARVNADHASSSSTPGRAP
jgi:ABC-type uncharacterized transport system permease subunit